MTLDDPTALGRFLTAADAAEILNVDLGTVLDLVNSNELPAIRVGRAGQVRIERAVLESYISALYEESRRRGLWQQSEFASLPELSDGRILRPGR
jgi:excisionase family DNA binding protein